MGVGYYYMLRAFHTQLALLSTFAIATALIQSYLFARRYVYAPFASLINDFFLIALWVVFAFEIDPHSIQMIVLPILYAAIDFYGIFEWRRLKRAQVLTNPA